MSIKITVTVNGVKHTDKVETENIISAISAWMC